jgi:hypothetical protein
MEFDWRCFALNQDPHRARRPGHVNPENIGKSAASNCAVFCILLPARLRALAEVSVRDAALRWNGYESGAWAGRVGRKINHVALLRTCARPILRAEHVCARLMEFLEALCTALDQVTQKVARRPGRVSQKYERSAASDCPSLHNVTRSRLAP